MALTSTQQLSESSHYHISSFPLTDSLANLLSLTYEHHPDYRAAIEI